MRLGVGIHLLQRGKFFSAFRHELNKHEENHDSGNTPLTFR